MSVQGQDSKIVVLIAPVTVTVATTASSYGYVDTLGYEHAQFIYTVTTGTATGVCAKQCAIREGTNSTAATAIVALTGGTQTAASVAWVCGALNTSLPVAIVMDVDLRARQRYLRCQCSVGEKAIPTVLCILSRGKKEPASDESTYVVNHIIA